MTVISFHSKVAKNSFFSRVRPTASELLGESTYYIVVEDGSELIDYATKNPDLVYQILAH